jgi:hypothetical protein
MHRCLAYTVRKRTDSAVFVAVRFSSDGWDERVRALVGSAAMNVISEAEACRRLGRRVAPTVCEEHRLLSGRMQHVSPRSASKETAR